MKIYGDKQSGNCMKVKYTADFLGLNYDWIAVDILKGESRTQAFLELNPMGQVPVIELEDGRCLSQSNAIISFLARGTKLLPDDSFDQAKAQEWLFWEQYSHEPYIAVCRFHMHYLGKSKDSREPWRVEKGEAALDAMEQALSSNRWLAADQFTIADIALFAYTHLAEEGGFDLSSRPQVRRWIGDCSKMIGSA